MQTFFYIFCAFSNPNSKKKTSKKIVNIIDDADQAHVIEVEPGLENFEFASTLSSHMQQPREIPLWS